jgi:hypothetical protein
MLRIMLRPPLLGAKVSGYNFVDALGAFLETLQ